MKRLIFLVLPIVFCSLFAQANDSQIREGYYACLKFLKLSPAKQAAVAKKTSYSLKSILWACKYQKRVGLVRMIKRNHEYERATRQGGGSSSTPAPEPTPNACYSSISCAGYNHQCVDHVCQDINPPISQCDAAHWCAAGETCENGVCH